MARVPRTAKAAPKAPQAGKDRPKGTFRRMDLTLAGLFGLLLVLALATVGLNIERLELAYDIRRLEAVRDEKQVLAAKLEIERDNLLSPAHLRQLASQHGMIAAGPGRVRSLSGTVAGRQGGSQ